MHVKGIFDMAHFPKSPTLRRLLKLVLLASVLGFGIKALLLHPVFIQLDANVVHKYAWYTTVLYYLIDGGLIDLAVFALCYPAALFAVWKDGMKRARALPVAFSLVTVGKFLVNYFVSIVTEGAFRLSGKEILTDLGMILVMLLMELAQFWIPIAVLCRLKKRYDERVAAAALRSELTETAPPAPVLPIARLLSLRNPLQLSAFLYSVILFLGLEISYHTYQLTLYSYYGETDGWLSMAVNLVTDLAFGVALYFVALLLFNRFHSREQADET